MVAAWSAYAILQGNVTIDEAILQIVTAAIAILTPSASRFN
jgi:hypothetical protein